jgi:hypothetical protein
MSLLIFWFCFIFDKVKAFSMAFWGKRRNILLKQLTFEVRFAKINMYVFLFILKGQKS